MHLRGLQRTLGLPLGTVAHHLRALEKQGQVIFRDIDRFKAFFPAHGMDRRDCDLLYYLRQEIPRAIALHLLHNPGATHAELAVVVPVSAATCQFHLQKLVKSGIVIQVRHGRRKRLTLVDPERIADITQRYRTSLDRGTHCPEPPPPLPMTLPT